MSPGGAEFRSLFNVMEVCVVPCPGPISQELNSRQANKEGGRVGDGGRFGQQEQGSKNDKI